jgi:hypothetical protein
MTRRRARKLRSAPDAAGNFAKFIVYYSRFLSRNRAGGIGFGNAICAGILL